MFRQLVIIALISVVISGCGEETNEQIVSKVFKVDESNCKKTLGANPFFGNFVLKNDYKKDLSKKYIEIMEDFEKNNPSQFVYEKTIFESRCFALINKKNEDLEQIKANALKKKTEYEEWEIDRAIRTGEGSAEVLAKAEKVKQEKARLEAEHKAKEEKAKDWEKADNEELKDLYTKTKALSIEGIVLPRINERNCKNTNDKWLLDNKFSQEKADIFKQRCTELGFELAK